MLIEVTERIRRTQYTALTAVNQELINLYWDIGQLIVERQAGDTWKMVVKRLSEDLQNEFPGIGGFSVSNLWRMKNFYEAHGASEKLASMVQEIAWRHNITMLEREFYRETAIAGRNR